MTDNNIRDEGTKAMSEMLKLNTTLTSLDLYGQEEERSGKEKERNEKIRMNDRQLDWR